MEPHQRKMHEFDGVVVRNAVLGGHGHVIERERCLVTEIRIRDPSEVAIGDHHVRLGTSALFGSSALGDILAPADREDLFVRLEVAPDRLVARAQELLEGRHDARAYVDECVERSIYRSRILASGVEAMAFEGLGSIGQIHVSVTDVDRAVAFYRDVLGIPFLFQVSGQPMAFFDCDGVRLYLGKPESEEFRSNPVLYFRVEDIEEAHRALNDRGIEFTDSPHVVHRTEDSELWMTAFKDPDGNNLVLMAERTVPSSGNR
jgi:predicted enzyme related to lactoylglutathione lyase